MVMGFVVGMRFKIGKLVVQKCAVLPVSAIRGGGEERKMGELSKQE